MTRSRSCCPSASRSDCPASALDVYRVLRSTNPSPYMYLLRLPDPTARRCDDRGWDIVGSSPEALVTVQDRQAT